MTFNQLQYVMEAAKIGSITKAARMLLLTQSNLSNTIRAVEQELGLELFIRTKDGICLTSEGEAFVLRAEAILQSYGEMMQLGDTMQVERFAIGIMPTSYPSLAFAELCRRHQDRKNMHMSMKNCDLDIALNYLQTNMIDLAILAMSPFQKYNAYDKCEQKKARLELLGSLPLNVCLRRNHPLLAGCDPGDPGKSFNFQALKDYPYVDYGDTRNGSHLRNATLQDTYAILPVNRNNVIWVFDRTQKDCIVSLTDAFTIGMTRSPVHRKLELISIPLPECFYEVYLCTSIMRPVSQLASEYVSLLLAELAMSPEFLAAT